MRSGIGAGTFREKRVEQQSHSYPLMSQPTIDSHAFGHWLGGMGLDADSGGRCLLRVA